MCTYCNSFYYNQRFDQLVVGFSDISLIKASQHINDMVQTRFCIIQDDSEIESLLDVCSGCSSKYLNHRGTPRLNVRDATREKSEMGGGDIFQNIGHSAAG